MNTKDLEVLEHNKKISKGLFKQLLKTVGYIMILLLVSAIAISNINETLSQVVFLVGSIVLIIRLLLQFKGFRGRPKASKNVALEARGVISEQVLASEKLIKPEQVVGTDIKIETATPEIIEDKTEDEERMDASELLKKATKYKKEDDYDKAIETLKKAYRLINRGEVEYTIETFLRLPMYIHESGDLEGAYKEFNKLLKKYPNDRDDIYDKMRLVAYREKDYETAIKYELLANLSSIERTIETLTRRTEENIKLYLKRAKKENLSDEVFGLFMEYIPQSRKPDFLKIGKLFDEILNR